MYGNTSKKDFRDIGICRINIIIRYAVKSICVLPEIANYEKINCIGICSDFIQKYNND